MIIPFRPPSASVLFDGQPVKTFHSPDGWTTIGLTPYYGSRQVGQRQVGFNSNPCPNGGLYRGPDTTGTFSPQNGYTGYWAYYEGCWATSSFPGASPIHSWWGSWYAPPSPMGPIYEPVYAYYLQYIASAFGDNGSEVTGALPDPYEVLFDTMAARDAAFQRHTTTKLGLLVCNPDTELQCGPSLKTANPCCIDCATIAARYQSIAAALQSAAGFTRAKADQLIAQAAENRKNKP